MRALKGHWLFRPIGLRCIRRWIIGAFVVLPLTLLLLGNLAWSQRYFMTRYFFAIGPDGVEFFDDQYPSPEEWPLERRKTESLYHLAGQHRWLYNEPLFRIRESLDHTLQITADSELNQAPVITLSQSDIQEIYRGFATRLRASGRPTSVVKLYLKGPGTAKRTNPRGVIKLIFTLAAWLGAVYGIGWFIEFSMIEIFRTTPRPGYCPNCKYDLAGLTSTVCPECGTECAP